MKFHRIGNWRSFSRTALRADDSVKVAVRYVGRLIGQSKIIAMAFSMAAEIERDLISRWQIHPKVYRPSLPNNRSQSSQLAQKARIEIILHLLCITPARELRLPALHKGLLRPVPYSTHCGPLR
jgi:hypothetical protein